MKNRTSSLNESINPTDQYYTQLIKEKNQIEQKITHLKIQYQKNIVSSLKYYDKYKKLGEKLLDIEREIIHKFPHNSL